MVVDRERTLKAHEFWLAKCGWDNRQRNAPRSDTPWNAFTPSSQLVNSVWRDRIVDVHDAETGTLRRFVRLGLVLGAWSAQRKRKANEARDNLDRAFAERLPVYGFEAEPAATKSDGGNERTIKHFFVDRAYRLLPHMGLRGDELIERLQLDRAFQRAAPQDTGFASRQAITFELLPAGVDAPGDLVAVAEGRGTPSGGADQHSQPSEGKHAEVAGADGEDGDDDAEEETDAEDLTVTELQARRTLPVLVDHVLRQRDGVLQPITYLAVARRIGRLNKNGVPWAKGLGAVLTRVTAIIDSAAGESAEKPPYLACIVVLSGGVNEGLPDDGVRDRWPTYEHLSRQEKQDRVLIEFDRILAYGTRWIEVLQRAGLAPLADEPAGEGTEQRSGGGWGGGESLAHRLLKLHVLRHPHLVGAEADSKGQVEFPLRSGDQLDVMFQTADRWIGVEVKSKVSDGLPADYERGIYQAVKYLAVLTAQARIDQPERAPEVQVVLVLESRMPDAYRPIAAALGVKVIEEVVPATEPGREAINPL